MSRSVIDAFFGILDLGGEYRTNHPCIAVFPLRVYINPTIQSITNGVLSIIDRLTTIAPMYIAGLNLPISSPQVLEALVVFNGFDFFRHIRSCMRTVVAQAESKGGRIRAGTMPILGRIVTTIHALAVCVPPVVYIGVVVFNKFRQPEWMAQFALSNEIAGVQLNPLSKGVLRLGACAAGLVLKNVTDTTFYHLGDQWHTLGVRMLINVQDSPSD